VRTRTLHLPFRFNATKGKRGGETLPLARDERSSLAISSFRSRERGREKKGREPSSEFVKKREGKRLERPSPSQPVFGVVKRGKKEKK